VVRYYVTPLAGLKADELRRLADDPGAAISERCKAIITLFGKHVALGSTSAEVADAIGNAAWLTEATPSVRELVLGEPDPVDSRRGNVFYLSLFPAHTSRQQSISLCFLIPGKNIRRPGEQGAEREIREFLRGEHGDPEVRLLQYAVIWTDTDSATTVAVRDTDLWVSETHEGDGRPIGGCHFRIIADSNSRELSPTNTWNLSGEGAPSPENSR